MKTSRAVLILACFNTLFALLSGAVCALEQEELSVSLAWSDQTPNPGDRVTVSMFCKSSSSEEITIYYLGINFDWMESESFVGFDLSDDPVSISGFGSHTFDSLVITIPEDVTIGTHSYFVGMDGIEGEFDSFSWDSTKSVIVVQDPKEENYNNLATEIASDITTANNASYQSSEAQSLLLQAENAYGQALSLVDQENWEDAIVALQNASDYLEQAELEEQNYEPESQQDDLLIIVGASVVVVVAILLIILMLRRNKKQTESDQPRQE
jgi:hypothetical protein